MSDNNPQIDIVLTTYNGEKYLAEQLDSLLGQTYSNIRILIFDDGSTDGTEAIISDYASKHKNIVLHKNITNRGYTMNFLFGIKKTDADYVMLCDQDDIWNVDKIEKTLDFMKKTEKNDTDLPVLVFTDADVYDGRTTEKCSFQRKTHLNPKKVDIGHLLMENKCIGCTVMINRALIGYLDRLPKAIRVHDWWLALIASVFGRVAYLDEMTLKYRQHEGNEIGGAEFGSYIKNRLSSVGKQRESIKLTYRQGQVFYKLYKDRLFRKDHKIVLAFATMEQASWFTKRIRMIRYGFKKSGIIRNIGLFFLM